MTVIRSGFLRLRDKPTNHIKRRAGRIFQMQAWADTGIERGAHRVEVVVGSGTSTTGREFVKRVVIGNRSEHAGFPHA